MNLFQKQQTTIGYNTIADGVDEDATVVPLVPPKSIHSRTKTNDHGYGKMKTGYWGPIIVTVTVFLTLLLGCSMYVGGPSDCGSLDHSVGTIVDGTAMSASPCVPATGTFVQNHCDTFFLNCVNPFDTCWQFNDDRTYCWTQSQYSENCYGNYCACIPVGAAWNEIDAKYVNPVTQPNSCGPPCQEVYGPMDPTPAPTPKPDPDAPCIPGDGPFSGNSYTGWQRQAYPFETCFQLGNAATYCWTKSYFSTQKHWNSSGNYCRCVPNGAGWNIISAEYVNPVTQPNSCGTPCLEIHQQ